MTIVTAPLPGRILSVKVKVGDSVGQDQELFVMEALKMENSVVAADPGTVSSIFVTNGDDVETGDQVMEIE